jgi:hypothetical protein
MARISSGALAGHVPAELHADQDAAEPDDHVDAGGAGLSVAEGDLNGPAARIAGDDHRKRGGRGANGTPQATGTSTSDADNPAHHRLLPAQRRRWHRGNAGRAPVNRDGPGSARDWRFRASRFCARRRDGRVRAPGHRAAHREPGLAVAGGVRSICAHPARRRGPATTNRNSRWPAWTRFGTWSCPGPGRPAGTRHLRGPALNIIDSSANRPGVGVLPPGDQREACANGGRAAPDAGYRRRVAV